MKKIGIVTLGAFKFLAVASVSAYLLRYTSGKIWIYIAIGLALLVISGLLAFFSKKSIPFNCALSAISAVALGFLIRAWYLFRGFDNPLWMMLLVTLAAVAIMLIIAIALDGDLDFDFDFDLDFSDGAEIGLEVTGDIIEGVADKNKKRK